MVVGGITQSFVARFCWTPRYVLGTQECSLDRETLLQKMSDGLGPEFILLHLQELQSIKLCIYARFGLSHWHGLGLGLLLFRRYSGA